jgi:hypothetical protein
MRDCPTVEDWGCGGGGLSEYIEPQRYVGVDSSETPFATVRADLATYDASADGIVLRHVLEHNEDWAAILDNAVHSFKRRLCIVLFTPIVNSTRVLHREPEYGNVPVIAFALQDLYGPIFDVGAHAFHETLTLPDALYGTETVIYAAAP